jgi:hypothetical protein
MLSLPHLEYVRRKDPRLGETIDSLRESIISLAKQAGLGPSGQIPAPQIESISVTATNGVFSISVTDKSATHLGISYFCEYADNPNFDNSHTLFMGPSRNENGLFLGSGTFYFRAFSQYQNSPKSAKVVFGGSTPTGVAGGGAIAGPTLPPSNGSGSGGSGGYGQTFSQRVLNTQ